uniref:tRNA (guanine(37)-N1)-methyltransferase n=1 Tax=Syphacia muris TaxID=451379 RepID=A0A0N5AI72_9BILA
MTGFSSILPPERVRGITKLSEFEKKSVLVPCLQISSQFAAAVIKLAVVRSFVVEKQSDKLRPAVDVPGTSGEKYILFDPEKINDSAKSTIVNAVQRLVGNTLQFQRFSFEVGYSDWNAKTCINAVLPKGMIFSGFTQAGHIVHVNLREELLPYKYVVGQILRDKISRCRTVVNKLGLIDNEFRTFQMDLLAGDADYITTVVSDGIKFKIDFSKTFWNTRLTTEHGRIWKKFDKQCVVFDCCTGVGPFVLPAARIPVRSIYANDLNPDCVSFLKENIKLNKLENYGNFYVSNLDANVFIRNVIGKELRNLILNNGSPAGTESSKVVENGPEAVSIVHILMNLPAKSLTFLKSFRGLLSDLCSVKLKDKLPFPILVHCHFFVKADSDVPVKWYSDHGVSAVKSNIGVTDVTIEEIHFVRKVAGRKWMLCVSFKVPSSVLFERVDESHSELKNTTEESETSEVDNQTDEEIFSSDCDCCKNQTAIEKTEISCVYDNDMSQESDTDSQKISKGQKRQLCQPKQDVTEPNSKRSLLNSD